MAFRKSHSSTPFIASWGDKIKNKGSISQQPAHFSDIMATCLDAAGAKYPSILDGSTIIPSEGQSLLPVLRNKKIPIRPIFAEHEGNRMVRLGDWKIVSSFFDNSGWELYNISVDRTEQNNLAKKYPEKVKSMEEMYQKWADRSDMVPFEQLWDKINKRQSKVE
ncbi:MAG TPA: sulfatase/phosphatase domain-containing protein [Bacteroidales bacterium]